MALLPGQLTKNYYDILGVPPSATLDEINKKFRKESLAKHPDKHPGKEAEYEPIFKELAEAHGVLKSEELRKEYDTRSEFGAHYNPAAQEPAHYEDEEAEPDYSFDAEDDDLDLDAPGFGFPTANNPYSFFALADTIEFIIRLRQEILLAAFLAEVEAQRRQPESPKNTGYALSDDANLRQVERQLSEWLQQSGKANEGFSCRITRDASGEETLTVVAPKQRAHEVMQFLESKGLVQSVQKGASYDYDTEEPDAPRAGRGR